MPLLFESGRMNSMPKKIDPALRERAVRLVLEHRAEYSTTTAAVQAVAKQVGVGKESLRRWVNQADVDAGDRPGEVPPDWTIAPRASGAPTGHSRSGLFGATPACQPR